MDRDQAVQFMHNLLRAMLSKKASDLFITAGCPPAFKVDGKMTELLHLEQARRVVAVAAQIAAIGR